MIVVIFGTPTQTPLPVYLRFLTEKKKTAKEPHRGVALAKHVEHVFFCCCWERVRSGTEEWRALRAHEEHWSKRISHTTRPPKRHVVWSHSRTNVICNPAANIRETKFGIILWGPFGRTAVSQGRGGLVHIQDWGLIMPTKRWWEQEDDSMIYIYECSPFNSFCVRGVQNILHFWVTKRRVTEGVRLLSSMAGLKINNNIRSKVPAQSC